MVSGNSANSPSSEALAVACQAGSSTAFAELVYRHHANLHAFLRRFCATPEDAADLTQDAFCRAYAAMSDYDARWTFKTWLFTIGRNLALSELRSRRRQRDADHSQLPQPASVCSPADAAVHAEAVAGLRTAMAQLPDEQQQALWLFHGEGMSVRDVACILGRSTVGVRVMLFRGRRQLARLLRHRSEGVAARPALTGRPATDMLENRVNGELL